MNEMKEMNENNMMMVKMIMIRIMAAILELSLSKLIEIRNFLKRNK